MQAYMYCIFYCIFYTIFSIFLGVIELNSSILMDLGPFCQFCCFILAQRRILILLRLFWFSRKIKPYIFILAEHVLAENALLIGSYSYVFIL